MPRAKAKREKILTKAAICAFLLVLIFIFSRYGPQPLSVLGREWEELEDLTGFYSNKERIIRFLGFLGPYSSAVFILLQALQVIVSPIPGELTGIVGGYLYGTTFGFIFSTLGLTLGSWVAFELANILGKPFVERFFDKRILQKFHFLTTHGGTAICFLLFVIPGFPKDILCYLLGLSPMSLGTFLIVTTIGRMPGTYLITVGGASIRTEDYYTVAVVGIICTVIAVSAYLYRALLFQWLKRISGKHFQE
jgi:uncharacterized membrane protein YdjX (TVP38/TMEM64 family)